MEFVSEMTSLGHTRIAVNFIVAIIFLAGIIFPIKNTVIPYWKKFGRPSNALLSRLGIRIFLLILVLYNMAFPLWRHVAGAHDSFSPAPLQVLAIPIYLGLGLLYLHSWFNHPDGLSGL